LESIQLILEAYPNLNCSPAASLACERGCLPILGFLLDHQPQILEDQEEAIGGQTPLLVTAIYGYRIDVLEFLLAKGISPNTNPPNHQCPLGAALSLRRDVPTILQMLLKAGADVNKLMEFPSSQYPSFSAFKAYMQTANLTEAVIQMLVDAGLNLGVRDLDTGDNIFHFRAETPADADSLLFAVIGNSDTQALLIDTPNFKGETPLMLAVMNANFSLLEKLLERKVDLNRSAFGRPSILHWMISRTLAKRPNMEKRELMAKLLLLHGAPTDKVYGRTGRTLLHEACSKRERIGLAKALLLEGHMDPNCTIPNRKTGGDPITPLMLAISQNDVDTVELLIQQGAIFGESERKALPRHPNQRLAQLLGSSQLPAPSTPSLPSSTASASLPALFATPSSTPFTFNFDFSTPTQSSSGPVFSSPNSVEHESNQPNAPSSTFSLN